MDPVSRMKTKNQPVADLIVAYRQDTERFARRLDTKQELRERSCLYVPQNVALSRPIWW